MPLPFIVLLSEKYINVVCTQCVREEVFLMACPPCHDEFADQGTLPKHYSGGNMMKNLVRHVRTMVSRTNKNIYLPS